VRLYQEWYLHFKSISNQWIAGFAGDSMDTRTALVHPFQLPLPVDTFPGRQNSPSSVTLWVALGMVLTVRSSHYPWAPGAIVNVTNREKTFHGEDRIRAPVFAMEGIVYIPIINTGTPHVTTTGQTRFTQSHHGSSIVFRFQSHMKSLVAEASWPLRFDPGRRTHEQTIVSSRDSVWICLSAPPASSVVLQLLSY
jgi:hypothetical protein